MHHRAQNEDVTKNRQSQGHIHHRAQNEDVTKNRQSQGHMQIFVLFSMVHVFL
jgi:hypothetical protein